MAIPQMTAAVTESAFTARYTAFRRMLADARVSRGYTQQQVADRLGKPQSFVSKYERGERRLDVVELIALSQVLDLDPCSIMRAVATVPPE